MNRRYVMTAIAACLVMSAMIAGTVSFGFFMDPVTTELGFDRSTFSLYFSLITVVGTITLPIYGRLIERFGTRPFVIFGGLWTGAAMAALSLCHSLPAFYGVGCLVGLGFFGCSYAAMPVIVSSWFAKKNGLIMGLAAACGGTIGMVLSLIFPQFIINNGWEAGYVLLGAVVCALTTPVGIFLLRSYPSDVGLAPYGVDSANARVEVASEPSGIPYRQALRMPQMWIVVFAFILLTGAFMISQHLAAYFVSIGFDAIMAGVFMSVISAGIIVTNIGAGAITDKLGLAKSLALCSIIYAISFLLLPMTNQIPFICLALILMSLGNANASVFAPMVTQTVFGTRDYASIWGLVSMACVLGQAIGAPLWGLAYDLTDSYVIAMYISAALIIIALLGLLWAVRSAANHKMNASQQKEKEGAPVFSCVSEASSTEA